MDTILIPPGAAIVVFLNPEKLHFGAREGIGGVEELADYIFHVGEQTLHCRKSRTTAAGGNAIAITMLKEGLKIAQEKADV